MAFHNLVTQQLHLTRSLIETTRSLHHTQTLAIRPDYHYITLEETKQVCVRACKRVYVCVHVCAVCTFYTHVQDILYLYFIVY